MNESNVINCETGLHSLCDGKYGCKCDCHIDHSAEDHIRETNKEEELSDYDDCSQG